MPEHIHLPSKSTDSPFHADNQHLPQICARVAGRDCLVVQWRSILLVQRRTKESLACLQVLKEILLNIPLSELENIWFKHDLGCVLFEVRLWPVR
jgi:hypothetical protein